MRDSVKHFALGTLLCVTLLVGCQARPEKPARDDSALRYQGKASAKLHRSSVTAVTVPTWDRLMGYPDQRAKGKVGAHWLPA